MSSGGIVDVGDLVNELLQKVSDLQGRLNLWRKFVRAWVREDEEECERLFAELGDREETNYVI